MLSEQFAPKPSTHFHYREERRAILRIVVFCIGLMIALPGAHADASKDCVQMQDLDRQISGCTEIITKGRETKDNLAAAYNNRGYAYGHKGDYDRAIADFSKALELNPKDAHLYHNRGAAYEDKGDHDRAIADYRRALQFDPSIEASKEGLKRLGVSP